MEDLQKLISFIEFTNKFREIERIIYLKNHPHPENDSEHSFQLALTAWYIIDSKKLSLDKNRVIKYALAHDLVEIYAGDTYTFDSNNDKHEREEAARIRILNEFPEFIELHVSIQEYEKKEDSESRFVYALDKILPIINIYLDEGKSLREREVTFEMFLENKTSKVSVSPEIKEYFVELVKILEEKKVDLFHKS